MSVFRTCVAAFENSTGHDIRERGTVLFKTFCEDLPLRVAADEEHEWRTLDNLRFIPHDTSPRPLGSINVSRYITRRVRFLTGVVSPNRLVRKEFQAVAWSQRTFYHTEPHQRVLMAYPNLSVPTAEEVVRSLLYVANNATDWPVTG